MESTFAPPAAADCPPAPDTLASEPAPGAPTATTSLIPPQVAERITIGPVAPWIIERPLEEEAYQYAGTNPMLLLDYQHDVGRQESYVRQVSRLDTVGAVHQASHWRLDFDPAAQRVTIHALLVRRGDQAVDQAKPDRLRVLQREGNVQSFVLHGRLTLAVVLEDVRVGDTLDLSYTVQSQEQIFPGHFARLTAIPTRTLRDFHLRVRFPTGRPMQWKSNDSKLAPAVHEEPADTVWSWHLHRLPGQEQEPNVPGWHFQDSWIQVTDFASWAEVAAGLAAAWKEEWQHPELLRVAASIAATAPTRPLRAEGALTFLQDEIRHVSLDSGFGNHLPHAPGVVIKRGFGDSKDKAFAAAHLLRLVGVPARPVLVNTVRRQSIREYLPMPDAFDHAIVEYEIEGRRFWADLSLPLQGGSILTRLITPFKLGLPLSPDVTKLEPIASSAADDHLELRETFLFDTGGHASILRVQVTATGRDAERWRRSLAHEGEEECARQRELFYRQIYSGARRVGNLEWQDDREINRLTLAENFDLREVLIPTHDAKSFLFRLPAHAIQSVLGFSESNKRKQPWEMRFPCHIEHIIEIDSPDLPPNLARTAQVESPIFHFSCHGQQRQGSASITCVIQILDGHVPAGEFEIHKAKVREAWPLTFLTGQLPPGTTIPWKKRSERNLLPRMISRVVAVPGPTSLSEAEPAPRIETAPALASPGTMARSSMTKAPQDAPPAVPRKETSAPAAEPDQPRERGKVNRPNPPPLPAESGTAPTRSRRRKHSPRRARRQRRGVFQGILIFIGAAVLYTMLHFFLHVL